MKMRMHRERRSNGHKYIVSFLYLYWFLKESILDLEVGMCRLRLTE